MSSLRLVWMHCTFELNKLFTLFTKPWIIMWKMQHIFSLTWTPVDLISSIHPAGVQGKKPVDNSPVATFPCFKTKQGKKVFKAILASDCYHCIFALQNKILQWFFAGLNYFFTVFFALLNFLQSIYALLNNFFIA